MTEGQGPLSDPLEAQLEVAVSGGRLHVARAGPPPGEAEHGVIALHGITATLMTWRTVARAVGARGRVCLLAPDLRGRGRSAALPGPYGIAAHVDDVLAVLDHVGASRAVLVGHSMGAYLGARVAADHPELVTGLVLLDAGLPLPLPDDPDAVLREAEENVVMRLEMTFPTLDNYVAAWRAHPAFAGSWNDDIDAYVHYDAVQEDGRARCAASIEAVLADTEELVRDEATRLALDRVGARQSVQLLRAERGLFDAEDDALIAADALAAFAAGHPDVRVEAVPGVNHYTLVMGGGPGPVRVAAAIDAACR